MRYKLKWRAGGDEPLQPEIFDTLDAAKRRARELLARYGERATIDVWNDDETWQIVSPAGIADWSRQPDQTA
jgi:hypothetical protein